MYDFFIAHSKEQKASIAIPLTEALRSYGFHVWLDRWYIPMGTQIFTTIDNAIAGSFMGIAVISQEFLGKTWTMHELKFLNEKSVHEKSDSLLLMLHKVDIDSVAQYISNLKTTAYERCDTDYLGYREKNILMARIINSYFMLKLAHHNELDFAAIMQSIEEVSHFEKDHKRTLFALIEMYSNSYDDVRSKSIALFNLMGYIKGISEAYRVGSAHEIRIAFRFISDVLNKAISTLNPICYDEYIAIERAVLFSLASISTSRN